MHHDIFILQSLGLSVFIEFRRGGIAGSLLNCRNIFLMSYYCQQKISHQLYGIRLDESIMVVIDPSCGGHAYMDMYQLHVPQFGRTSVQTKSPIFVSFHLGDWKTIIIQHPAARHSFCSQNSTFREPPALYFKCFRTLVCHTAEQ